MSLNTSLEKTRLDPLMLDKTTTNEELLEFYMGKNTQNRQKFIIENLKIELIRHKKLFNNG